MKNDKSVTGSQNNGDNDGNLWPPIPYVVTPDKHIVVPRDSCKCKSQPYNNRGKEESKPFLLKSIFTAPMDNCQVVVYRKARVDETSGGPQLNEEALCDACCSISFRAINIIFYWRRQ